MKQFQFIKVEKQKKNSFNLDHERKFTLDFGKLTPVFLQEVIPGDHFKVDMEYLVRMQPMLAPVMHRINSYVHFFFVPNRIVWSNWEKFITNREDGGESINLPKISGSFTEWLSKSQSGSLADYMGIPIDRIDDIDEDVHMPDVSQLPFRAYQLIFNEYYRDQNLQNEVDIHKDSDADVSPYVTNILDIQTRNLEKDYFTSALPFAQAGDPVKLPLGTTADVVGKLKLMDSTGAPATGNLTGVNEAGTGSFLHAANTIPGDGKVIIHANVDLQNATAATVSDLRKAFSIQRWLEKNARAGSRYIENILMHFGVLSSDARLQRPEYLGGGKLPIMISEVLQTSQTSATPQGNMAGHGISAGIPGGFNRSFEEHGYIIGIMSVMPRTAYQQGLSRMFTKFTPFDYYWPDFAHIGEQPVKNSELYLNKEMTVNEGTFGYQPRYTEYRYAPDSVHGDFRTSYDFWHLGRKFGTRPVLNSSFIQCQKSSYDRIFPVITSNGKLICQCYFKVNALRPIAKFGDPI